MYKKILLLSTFFLPLLAEAQKKQDWKLKMDKDGIKVYARPLFDSDIKELKLECTVNATLSQLVAVLLDIKTSGEWVYSTKSVTLLKQVSPSELYYHSEVAVPWPVSNRDFIAHIIVTQDPHTRIVTVNAPTIPDYIPHKPNVVRVPRATGKWVIIPVTKKSVKIEYTLMVDPGGSIPAWLINMFATKGPYESVYAMRKHVQKPNYANVHLPFITDY
jgi:hypothetical protein